MLILLPPSEGKNVPRRGKSLDLPGLSMPALAAAREQVLTALVGLCEGDPATAARVLDVPKTRLDLVDLDARVRTSPTARAERVYAGVLYEALGLSTLSSGAKRRASSRLLVTSSLFGAVGVGDRIPPYRLSGGASLPGLGGVAAHWRLHLGPALVAALGDGLLVDLRSSTYAAFWRPPAALAGRVATVRVLHESDGQRSVVSHFNKATKGRLVRDLLIDGARPRSPQRLADDLGRLGWRDEVVAATPRGTQLDVVVGAV